MSYASTVLSYDVVSEGKVNWPYMSLAEIAQVDPPFPKTSPWNQTWSGSDDRLWRYGHLKIFPDGGRRPPSWICSNRK